MRRRALAAPIITALVSFLSISFFVWWSLVREIEELRKLAGGQAGASGSQDLSSIGSVFATLASRPDIVAHWRQENLAVLVLGVLAAASVSVVLYYYGRSAISYVEERDASIEALEANQQRLRDFALSSSGWLWEMDGDLRFSYISERSVEILGKPHNSYIGKRRDEIIYAHGVVQLSSGNQNRNN